MQKPVRNMLTLGGVCLLVIGASLFLGQGWREPWRLLAPESSAVLQLRILRILLGALIGASLAVSGGVTQTVLRNPLAEPYVLGLSAGAGLGIAAAALTGLHQAHVWLQPLLGFVGAMASLGVVFVLTRSTGRPSSSAMILAGVVWGSLCGSVLMFLASRANTDGMHAVLWWFLGDLEIFDERLLGWVAAINLAILALLMFRTRDLNALSLGDEPAAALGLHPARAKWFLLTTAAVLASTSVCLSGLIAFAGLVVPHVARALVGADHRRLLPASMLLGAAFLCLADGLGRTILYPTQVPVGIFTSLTGAPFFLLLLRNRQRAIWMT